MALNNRAHIGRTVYKGMSHPGGHEAITDRNTWDKVHAILAENARTWSAPIRRR